MPIGGTLAAVRELGGKLGMDLIESKNAAVAARL